MMIIVAALVGSDAAQMYDYVQLCRQKSTSIPYPELDKCKMRDDALALSDDVAVVLPGDEIDVARQLDDAQIQESYGSVGECPLTLETVQLDLPCPSCDHWFNSWTTIRMLCSGGQTRCPLCTADWEDLIEHIPGWCGEYHQIRARAIEKDDLVAKDTAFCEQLAQIEREDQDEHEDDYDISLAEDLSRADADEDELEEFASAITQGKCHSAAIVQRA